MKTLSLQLRKLFHSVKALLQDDPAAPQADWVRGKGESLLLLHESQNRVIEGIFKICIGGLFAFLLVLLSFTLFVSVDPAAPSWMIYLMLALQALLLFGLFRMMQEFRLYRGHFAEITARLREKIGQVAARPVTAIAKPPVRPAEHRLVTALKPKEYLGWDAKPCVHCHKSIELMANVCQHCGHEQDTLLAN
ncbi:MAG: hypothetical protein HY423_11105 [Candidatus Lambdaproteobacteria bacterium]|nr:hypothetical protein [Candidatus Lambdaproteobacteria bacterium]